MPGKAQKQTISKKLNTMSTLEKYQKKMDDRNFAISEFLKDIMSTLKNHIDDVDDEFEEAISQDIQPLLNKFVSKITPRITKPKPLNMPKNPCTAYILFSSHTRPIIKGENPEMIATDITKEIGKRWKNITESEKEHWTNEHLKSKSQWEIDIEEWRSNFPDEAEEYDSSKPPSKKSVKDDKHKPKTAFQLFIKWMSNTKLSHKEKCAKWKDIKNIMSTVPISLKGLNTEDRKKAKIRNSEIKMYIEIFKIFEELSKKEKDGEIVDLNSVKQLDKYEKFIKDTEETDDNVSVNTDISVEENDDKDENDSVDSDSTDVSVQNENNVEDVKDNQSVVSDITDAYDSDSESDEE